MMNLARRLLCLHGIAWALFASATAAGAAQQNRVAGQVISLQGRVEVVRAGVAQPAVPRMDLFEGDAVRTGPASRAAILLADESRVKLNAHSFLRLRAVAARPRRGILQVAMRALKTVIELVGGEMWVQTAEPPGAVEIETPTVTASIRGTELNLAVVPDGESRLALLQGQVEYRNDFGAIVLQKGEIGIARPGQAPQRQVLLNPEDAVQWSLYYPGLASLKVEGLAGAALITQKALLSLLTGDVAQALELIDEALRLDPKFAPAYGLRSNIALVQNRKDEALKEAQRGVEANPDSSSIHIDLSLAWQAHFQLDAALAEAKKAVELDPKNGRAHLQLARLLFGFDRIEEAWEAAQKAQTLEPDEPSILATVGFIQFARLEIASAMQAFERAIESGASSGEPHLGLGLVYFRQGKVEEGLRSFQAAVLMEPLVALFHSYLGKALYQVERREDGLASLERARDLDPRDPTPYLYKGIFLTDLNRPAEAIEAIHSSIVLNDNRAVYRSRLLLDRDLAARNVDLTRSYLALGQLDRAFATGIRALHEDPQSSSAHLFFGSAVFSLFRQSDTATSEFLQTRMLLPVNQNTFNTFPRRYTKPLEQPSLEGNLDATWGNFNTQEGSAGVYGGTERIAGSQFLDYERTDGPKSRNSDQRLWGSDTIFKWAPTARSTVLTEFFHLDVRGGDTLENRRAFTPNDPIQFNNSHATFFSLGYQAQSRPENNLLLFAQAQSQHFRTLDPGLFDIQVRQPFYNLQAAYLHKIAQHQLWLAAEYLNGDFQDSALPFIAHNRSRNEFVSLVFQDVWQALPYLYLTAALRYDNAEDRIVLSAARKNSSVFSPQLGLLWRVTPGHTLRLAAFKSFQTPNSQRLFPSQIAGFFSELPIDTSSISKQYHVAWDADVSPTTFFTLGAFHREVDMPNSAAQRRTGGNLAINQLIGRYWGASLSYFRVYRDEPEGALGVGGTPVKDGTDDLVRAGLFFVHPSGFSVGGSLAYAQQDLGRLRAPGAPRDFWLTSFAASYEFPGKWAVLRIGVDNVFKQRFDLSTDPLARSFISTNELPAGRIFVNELPVRRVFATLRVNF